jgi:hypothetical protein
MAEVSINHIHKEVLMIKQDLELIKNILSEEGKLSDYAKEKLLKARKTLNSEYLNLDELD